MSQDIIQQKYDLRKAMLTTRDDLDPGTKGEMDERLCGHLRSLIIERGINVIHTYLPMGSEVALIPLIGELLAQGKTIVAPRVLKGRRLEHLVLKAVDALEGGIYGTRHPSGNHIYTGNYDLIIVPGLAFDKQHYRLGYGAGYYDIFLSSEPQAYKLGVCYPFQLLELIPHEAHDVPLDAVMF